MCSCAQHFWKLWFIAQTEPKCTNSHQYTAVLGYLTLVSERHRTHDSDLKGLLVGGPAKDAGQFLVEQAWKKTKLTFFCKVAKVRYSFLHVVTSNTIPKPRRSVPHFLGMGRDISSMQLKNLPRPANLMLCLHSHPPSRKTITIRIGCYNVIDETPSKCCMLSQGSFFFTTASRME